MLKIIIANNNNKCNTFGAELDHAYTLHSISIDSTFTLTTLYLAITLVGNDRQLNWQRGNFNDLNGRQKKSVYRNMHLASPIINVNC